MSRSVSILLVGLAGLFGLALIGVGVGVVAVVVVLLTTPGEIRENVQPEPQESPVAVAPAALPKVTPLKIVPSPQKIEDPPGMIRTSPPLPRDKIPPAPTELKRLASVNALRFSRDGSKLATIQNIGDGALINVLQIWDLKTGKQLFKLHHGNDETRYPVFSSDGKRVACHYFYETKVKVWDVETGAELATFSAPKGVRFTDRLLHFSPDGDSLTAITEHRLYRLDVPTRSVRLLEASAFDGHFHFVGSPIARDLLLTAIDLHRIGFDDGDILSCKKMERVEAMAMSGDGKTLAVAYFPSHVELFDAVTLESRGILQRDKTNQFVCYTQLHLSHDGRFLAAVPYFQKAVGTFRSVDYWDVAAKKYHSLDFDGFYHVAMSPDGGTLVVAPPQSYLAFVDPVKKEKQDRFP